MYCMGCTNRVDKCRCTEDALIEAQAKIACLQSEVERLKTAYINATEKRIPEDIAKAHNNAVRLAANQVIAGDTVTNTQRRILSLLIPAQREDE